MEQQYRKKMLPSYKLMKNSKNVLLSKCELGQVKAGFHDLPPAGHVYGLQPDKDKYGAREVISNWDYHKPTGVGEAPKDFKALNRQGAIQGCTNAKDIAKFRETSDIRMKIKEGQKFFDIKLPPEEFVFGIPNRPSTPIKNVVCNNYAREFDQLQQEKQAVLKVLADDTNKTPQCQAQNLKQSKNNSNRKEEIEKNNFKLGKFKNVESKVKPMMTK